jgi:hypothetical protein
MAFLQTSPCSSKSFRVPFTKNAPTALASSNVGYEFIVQAANLTTCPGTCIRPVGLVFGKDGRLFVTSDSSGEVSRQLAQNMVHTESVSCSCSWYPAATEQNGKNMKGIVGCMSTLKHDEFMIQ